MTPRRLFPGFLLAVATGLGGVLLGVSPAGFELEEQFGLDWLFLLRGPRPAPPEVVVVSIDKDSAERFGLPNEPRKWPRALHARLIDNLARAGAEVVGFDIHFEEPRDPREDRQLAQAIERAGNVVLLEFLRKEILSLPGGTAVAGEAVLERLVPPQPALARAAVATAPFPLPKVAVKVSQFWLFKGGAGDPPTLPVVMLQQHALPAYADLRRVLNDIVPEAVALPADAATLRRERRLRPAIEQLRAFLQQSWVGEQVQARLAADPSLGAAPRRLLMSLVRVYRDRDSRYLNYYGPPRSIATLPYHRVWEADGRRGAPSLDLRGKLVLVGFSERRQPEQQDGFYTVYSQPESGLDISGVEIAATGLANMIEDNPVRPLRPAAQIGLLFAWGLLIGLLALAGHVVWGVAAVAVAGLVYLAAALQVFSAQALWLPVVVPLVIQAPVALFAAAWWSYRDVARERSRIRQAFRHYLPERAVQALARDLHATPGGELMHGVCLATDAARYTALAERLAPEALAAFMNRYYEALFQPVREHGGFVSDVVGDAMLAVWAQVQPDAQQRARACRAALAVAHAADGFRESGGAPGFDTRLGLHAGPILLGNIGTADHLEYRAVGDIVNTAARLQALNKRLGTRLLASAETVAGLNDLLVRPLGSFRLPGKTRPTAVVEILGYATEAEANQRALTAAFTAALTEVQAHRLDVAQAAFGRLLASFPGDGPARFYAAWCAQRQAGASAWDGIVDMTEETHRSAMADAGR